MTDDDLTAIRSRYLGVDKKKRKVRKMNDRKFVFDWDEQEDTLEGGEAPSSSVKAPVMFGRGHLAGMDDGPRERGQDERHTDVMERRQATKVGVDERHWTKKPLNEMKERDWRIFREDFSIAARGTQAFQECAVLANSQLRRQHSPSTQVMARVRDTSSNLGHHCTSRLRGTFAHSASSNPHRLAISRSDWDCRDWYVPQLSATRSANWHVLGSGKTAAFVIPMLVYISKLPPLSDDNRHLGPFALILAPTRELAQQIESETRKFAAPLGYTTVSIVGGVRPRLFQFYGIC